MAYTAPKNEVEVPNAAEAAATKKAGATKPKVPFVPLKESMARRLAKK